MRRSSLVLCFAIAGCTGAVESTEPDAAAGAPDGAGQSDGGPTQSADAGINPNDGSANADFQARCAAAGVMVCEGFDDPALFAQAKWPASGLYAAGNGALGATQDMSIAASGAGSLKFTIPSNGGANSAGYWRQLFGKMFGAQSTFYVQFRQRFSPEYLTNKWPQLGGGSTFWKQQIISNDNSTCGNVELTTVNGYNRGRPTMYSQCGADGLEVNLGNGDYLQEQGATSADVSYNCHYQSANNVTGSCFMYPSDTWVAFYYKVSIGAWGQPDSTIQAWVAVGGGPYQEWINMPNHTLYEDSTKGADYDMVTLLPYMTARDPAVSAGPTAYTWYDELIVSTQPIAAPNN